MSWVPCPNCQAYQNIAGVAAGSTLSCPACGNVFVIAAAEPVASVRPTAGTYGETAPPTARPGHRLCPDCQTPAPAAAALCVHCGLDFRSGKKHGTVRVRRSSASLQLRGFGPIIVLGWSLGGLFLLLGLVLMAASHSPVLGLVCMVMPGLGVVGLGVALAFGSRAHVSITKDGDAPAVCTIVREMFGYRFHRRRLRLSAGDDYFVFSHTTPPELMIVMAVMIVFGIIPGLLWWFLLAQGRTYLQIRNRHKGPVCRLWFGWDEASYRELVDVIREVEYVPIERE